MQVALYDARGRLARVIWCTDARGAKARVDEAEPDMVLARVRWPDGSTRDLNRPAIGAPWVAGPRVRLAMATEDERTRESA